MPTSLANFAGIFQHNTTTLPPPRAERVLGSGPRFEAGGLTVTPAGEVTSDGAWVAVFGQVERRPDVDHHLGTTGASDGQLFWAAHQRYGDGAWLRIPGEWVVALYDPVDEALHLARSPGAGSPLVYLVRQGERTLFGTELPSLLGEVGALDQPRLREWVEAGLWSDPERTAYSELETVPPGTTFVVQKKGRNRRHRFWTFAPLTVPRRLSLEVARAELQATLQTVHQERRAPQRCSVYASGAALGCLAKLYGQPPSAESTPVGEPRLTALAQALPGPLPRSRLEALAGLPPGPLLTDLGVTALMGTSRPALSAFLTTLAHAFESTPKPGLLRDILRLGQPIADTLGEPFGPELWATGQRVLERWRGHLPPELASRLPGHARPAPPARTHGPVLTGETFLDRRFIESQDRGLELELLAARQGRPWLAAPFADVRVVELIFQLPPELFIAEGTVALLLGGQRLAHAPSAGAERADREAGLALYLASARAS
ncbi:MAG: hypothetical protein IPG45_12040 [Deltaproteobacteria bacterium]|nr:hypothetical protein [Deltaproteobacteria bacterium]